jgi:hypothetical protein
LFWRRACAALPAGLLPHFDTSDHCVALVNKVFGMDGENINTTGNPGNVSFSTEKQIFVLRATMLVCLVAATVLAGYGSFALVNQYEERLMHEEFHAVTSRFKESMEVTIQNSVYRLQTLAAVMSTDCPTDAHFPNCSYPMNPFVKLSKPLVESGDMRMLAYAPIITSDQVDEFEAFAYSFYESEGYPGLGQSHGFKGISAVNATTGLAFHDTAGFQHGGHKILMPVLQAAPIESNRQAIMFNLYSQQIRVNAIDFMLDCYKEKQNEEECTSITDTINLVQDGVFRPAVLILQPFAPRFNVSGNASGLVYSAYNWDTLLTNSLPSYVTGIDIVLEVSGTSYSFR